MQQDFNFSGILNGVKYTDPQQFMEALKKASEAGEVKSVVYRYSSSTNNDQKQQNEDKKETRQPVQPVRRHSDDTIARVSEIKKIINQVADFSDKIGNTSEQFTGEQLSSMQDILRSSIEKIKYLINGMGAEDRAEFCEKMHDGLVQLAMEADSESKDLIYEEAKFRKDLTEENEDIEKEIEDLKKDYDDNLKLIEESNNRCTASEDLANFFTDLAALTEGK